MPQFTNFLRAIAILVMSGSAFTECHAQEDPVIADIKAIFTPKSVSQNLVGDKIAIADDVQCVISNSSDLSFSNDGIYIPKGTIFTITSNTFKNIMGVRLYFGEVEPQVVQIFAADGVGFTSISELNDKMANFKSSKNGNSVRFYFSNPLVLLSKVQFEMVRDETLIKIEVSLDVEPEFLIEDGDTIYGDDPIPFVKRSNYVPYLYGIDIMEETNPDEFFAVPEDGIKLAGQTKGEHTVFLNVDDNMTLDYKNAIKTVTVNYDPVKPDEGSTTLINSIVNEEESAYYDLAGRRVAPKSGQLLIRKVGSTSKLIRY